MREDALERFSDFSLALRIIARFFQFNRKIHTVLKFFNQSAYVVITADEIRDVKRERMNTIQRLLS